MANDHAVLCDENLDLVCMTCIGKMFRNTLPVRKLL